MGSRSCQVKAVEGDGCAPENAALDGSLREIAQTAAQLFPGSVCSIMLLEGDDLVVRTHYGDLPEAAYQEAPAGIAAKIAAGGEPRMVNDILDSPFAPLARRPGEKGGGFLSAPIRSGGRIVGVINISDRSGSKRFSRRDLHLLTFPTQLVARTLEASRLEGLLRSRLMQTALARRPGQEIVPLAPDSDRLASMVAKTFYREMTRAGFGTDQIIRAATEIISLLGTRVKKHRERKNRSASRRWPEEPLSPR